MARKMVADDSSSRASTSMTSCTSMIYTLTPEVPFSPSNARNYMYKIGTTLSGTETRQLEYKIGHYAINNLEEHIRKYGSAFLNSDGGTLVMGVADNGIVVGVDVYSKSRLKQRIEDEFKQFEPRVHTDLYEIDIVPTDRKEKYVIELHVRAGAPEEIYVGKENKMYIKRDGSVQGPLWPRNIKDIVIQKLTKSLQTDNSSTSSQ